MPRLFVRDIQPQMQIDEVYRIADRQLRANRQGSNYLLMQLQDSTGQISAMRWNADERLVDRFPKGSFVRIVGASQLHNGNLQIIANNLQPIDVSQIETNDFDTPHRVDVVELWDKLVALISGLDDVTIKRICEAFLQDPVIENGLRLAPAGVKTHHAYVGGLLEHIVSLMKLADLVASHYEHMNRDLLIAGAFLHDIGKLRELAFEGELNYTDSGQLLGHLVQGVVMIEEKVRALQASGVDLDYEVVLRLEHIVVSHHGLLEHGSPKVPMSMEAIAFQFLDDMDAKLNAARELVTADRTKDAWTPFNQTLGRKLYKSSFGQVTKPVEVAVEPEPE